MYVFCGEELIINLDNITRIEVNSNIISFSNVDVHSKIIIKSINSTAAETAIDEIRQGILHNLSCVEIREDELK